MTEAKHVLKEEIRSSDKNAQSFNDSMPRSEFNGTAGVARPTNEFLLRVSDIHELSILEYGNPKGIPAVFLHGGPGVGVSVEQVASFDLDTYHIVTFDQRGAGRSTPVAEIAENTTQHLIADMEVLREKLGIERWLVTGGSWGSCLALAYGITHSERCLGFRLHGIFLGGQEDIDWWFHGCRAIFPDHWQEFAEFVPESERGDLLAAYYKRLTSGDPAQEQAAAQSLRGFSARTQTFEPDTNHVSKLLKPEASLAVSRLFTHYCVNRAFLPDNYLIENIDRIRHLPAEIVQARYDTVTPMMTAWKLKESWPEAGFTIVTLANHQSTIGPMADALAAASARLARQLTWPHSSMSAIEECSMFDTKTADTSFSMTHYIDICKAVKPAVSPDGELLAYLSDESGAAQVWVCPLAGGTPRQLTNLPEPVGNLAFNPKNRDLLITTDWGGDERHQLWLIDNAEGEPHLLTTDTTVVHAWGCWSPDGAQIAYGANYRDRSHMDIHVMAVATGETKCVYEGVGWRTPTVFAPDGKSLLVNDCRRAMTDQDFYRLDLETGVYENILPHEGRARYLAPKFFKCGSGILLIADQEREYLSVMVKPHDTASLAELAAFKGQDVEALAISPDQSRIALVLNRQGWNDVVLIDRDGAVLKRIETPVAAVVASVAWTPDGTSLILPMEGAATSGDIWRYDLESGVFTRLTDAPKAKVKLPTFQEPTVTSVASFDGLDIPYFVYKPERAAGPHGYPVMMIVHGGPEAQWKPDFRADIQCMLARGIMVIAPNIRGSTGYGRAYQHLDDRELRMDSVADLKAVRMALAARGDVDESRIGVFGRSYGGFMVLSAMTEYPDLWKLGVEYYGIANFLTLLQTTGPWRKDLRAIEYGDPETMRDELERFSPINRIGNIAAPLMIAHGLEDPRVTPCESEMLYSRLRGLGKPVEYLRVPHEGHGFARIENRRRVFGALARFIDENL